MKAGFIWILVVSLSYQAQASFFSGVDFESKEKQVREKVIRLETELAQAKEELESYGALAEAFASGDFSRLSPVALDKAEEMILIALEDLLDDVGYELKQNIDLQLDSKLRDKMKAARAELMKLATQGMKLPIAALFEDRYDDTRLLGYFKSIEFIGESAEYTAVLQAVEPPSEVADRHFIRIYRATDGATRMLSPSDGVEMMPIQTIRLIDYMVRHGKLQMVRRLADRASVEALSKSLNFALSGSYPGAAEILISELSERPEPLQTVFDATVGSFSNTRYEWTLWRNMTDEDPALWRQILGLLKTTNAFDPEATRTQLEAENYILIHNYSTGVCFDSCDGYSSAGPALVDLIVRSRFDVLQTLVEEAVTSERDLIRFVSDSDVQDRLAVKLQNSTEAETESLIQSLTPDGTLDDLKSSYVRELVGPVCRKSQSLCEQIVDLLK